MFSVITYAAVALSEMNADIKIITSKDHYSRQCIPVEGIPFLKNVIRPCHSKQSCLTSCLNGWNHDFSFNSGESFNDVYVYIPIKVIK